MKKLLYTLFLLFFASTVFAVNITVPSAPGNGYFLTSIPSGAYTASSTKTAYFGNILATSTRVSTITNLGGKLDASGFSGTERGTQNNAAYAALPSTGGSVFNPNGSVNYTTPIVFGTDFKPVLMKCDSGGGGSNFSLGGGATMIYTPTTGIAVTFNTNNYIVSGVGIENCDIQGTNGTTARTNIGVDLNGSNGAFDTQLNGVTISGFGTGVKLEQNTSFDSIINSTINYNGVNFNEPNTSGANCENIRGLNDVFADANNQTGGATSLNGFIIQQSGNCQSNFGFSSFDDNQIKYDQFGGTANVNSLIGDHQEDPNGTAYPMIVTNSGGLNIVTNLIGGDEMNDDTSGQFDQNEVAGTINMLGFTSDSNNNVSIPVTRIVNALASSTVITWSGLTCKGANATSFIYGLVPCSPMGSGSDYGQPSFYVASSTSKGVGVVDIATSTTNFSVPNPAVLNIGDDPVSGSATTTINMDKIQLQGRDALGAETCAYPVGTAWVVQAGPCNK